jgi:DNA-binding MarR family transcriptional regulator
VKQPEIRKIVVHLLQQISLMRIEDAIRQEHFISNLDKAMINLLYTANQLRDQQNQLLKQHGLLIQHYNTMRIIKGRHPKPVSPGEIKEVMLDKANDVTRLLDKLVEMKLVKRAVCTENRRKVDVILTPKGLDFLKQQEKVQSEVKSDIRKRLSDKEAGQLSDLLDKLRV